jgi:hypothetical protein
MWKGTSSIHVQKYGIVNSVQYDRSKQVQSVFSFSNSVILASIARERFKSSISPRVWSSGKSGSLSSPKKILAHSTGMFPSLSWITLMASTGSPREIARCVPSAYVTPRSLFTFARARSISVIATPLVLSRRSWINLELGTLASPSRTSRWNYRPPLSEFSSVGSEQTHQTRIVLGHIVNAEVGEVDAAEMGGFYKRGEGEGRRQGQR